MTHRKLSVPTYSIIRGSSLALLACLGLACSEAGEVLGSGSETGLDATTGDGDPSGDGDGAPSGDGDGDPSTTGDGDGDNQPPPGPGVCQLERGEIAMLASFPGWGEIVPDDGILYVIEHATKPMAPFVRISSVSAAGGEPVMHTEKQGPNIQYPNTSGRWTDKGWVESYQSYPAHLGETYLYPLDGGPVAKLDLDFTPSSFEQYVNFTWVEGNRLYYYNKDFRGVSLQEQNPETAQYGYIDLDDWSTGILRDYTEFPYVSFYEDRPKPQLWTHGFEVAPDGDGFMCWGWWIRETGEIALPDFWVAPCDPHTGELDIDNGWSYVAPLSHYQPQEPDACYPMGYAGGWIYGSNIKLPSSNPNNTLCRRRPQLLDQVEILVEEDQLPGLYDERLLVDKDRVFYWARTPAGVRVYEHLPSSSSAEILAEVTVEGVDDELYYGAVDSMATDGDCLYWFGAGPAELQPDTGAALWAVGL